MGKEVSKLKPMNDQFSALILAKPGQRRESVRVLLTAIQHTATVCVTHDWQAAQTTGFTPNLIVLDLDLPAQEQLTLLGRVKAEWPQASALVFVNDEVEKALLSTGAEAVLIRGVKADKLLAKLESLLTTP